MTAAHPDMVAYWHPLRALGIGFALLAWRIAIDFEREYLDRKVGRWRPYPDPTERVFLRWAGVHYWPDGYLIPEHYLPLVK